ncbi:hypothetical protein HMPREF9715_02450, partial [Myroides odoratimimus CIP 101113]
MSIFCVSHSVGTQRYVHEVGVVYTAQIANLRQ